MEYAVHVVPACYTTMSHDGHMIITPLMTISSNRCKFSKKKVGLVCIFLLADSPSFSCFGVSLFLSTRSGKEMVSTIDTQHLQFCLSSLSAALSQPAV